MLFIPRWLHQLTCCLGLTALMGGATLTLPALTQPAFAQYSANKASVKKATATK